MTAPAPLTPPECDLRDYQYIPLDIVRLLNSEFHSHSTDAEWRAGVTLWMKSFHHVPAASLPDDDRSLARAAELGTAIDAWKKVKARALHGWIKCSDGRLYHPVVAEKALEGWIEKLRARKSSAAGNAKRYGHAFDPAPFDQAIDEAIVMLVAVNPGSKLLKRRAQDGKESAPSGKPQSPSGTVKSSQGEVEVEVKEEGKKESGAPPAPELDLGGQPPPPPELPEHPKTAKKRALPELFPGQPERLWALGYWRKNDRDDLCERVDDEVDQFRDHHAKERSMFADWAAAWRTWTRNAVRINQKRENVSRGTERNGASARPASSFASSFSRAVRSRGAGGLLEGGTEGGATPGGSPGGTSEGGGPVALAAVGQVNHTRGN